MATEYDENGVPIEESGNDNSPAGLRKYADTQAARATAAETELATLRREKAIRDAGLDKLNEAQVNVLQGASADELRKNAEALGFVQAEQAVAPEVQQGHERIAQAAQTATTQVTTSKEDEYAAAKTPEEVIAIAQKHGSKTTWDAYQ